MADPRHDPDRGLLRKGRPAVDAYEAKTAHHTLLARPGPDREILGPIEAAIDQCTANSGAKANVPGPLLRANCLAG
jgi:hypothetical protein